MDEYLASKKRYVVLVIISTLFLFFSLFFSPPLDFPSNKIVIIPKGTSIFATGKLLKENKIISSPSVFSIIVKIVNPSNGIIAGGYSFTAKKNVISVALRLAKGDSKLSDIRITFREGLNVREIAKLCDESLPLCEENKFVKLALPYEGYLYPDTYFFLQSSKAEDVIQIMKDTFEQKISQLDKEIRSFGKSQKEILIMASILEKEAQNFENMRAVASILWKRLAIGMPLQVDATLQYAIGKNTYELTTKDLATTSPYNTYTNRDLPPTPIANPGIDSIRAAIDIKPTKYLYYLTDKKGNFYFAETHEKHVLNKQKYLNSF
ncbi:MAG: endolytic transglycosylase MltG [Patescibacteria group bacterium]